MNDYAGSVILRDVGIAQRIEDRIELAQAKNLGPVGVRRLGISGDFGDRRHNLEIESNQTIVFLFWNFEVMAPVPEISYLPWSGSV